MNYNAIVAAIVGRRRASGGGGGSPPSFSAQSAPAGTNGVSYSYTFVASGSPTYALGTGSLPAGLSLSSGGVLSGTPTTNATYTFTVVATNAYGSTSSTSQSVTISALATPVFSAQSAPGGTNGTAYNYTFVASGSPTYALGTGSLPAGLTLSSGGVLSGTPTTNTTYTFTVVATNGAGSTSSTSQSVTISAASSAITPALRLSRSGTLTAPIAMLFDASGTTTSLTGITDTFGQLEYYMTYGDVDGGTHAVTSLSRNSDIGAPIFDHLYVSAQSVTATLRVRAGLRWAYQSNQGVASPYKQNNYCYVDPADPVNGTSFNTYKAANDHTATSSFATDLAAGHWTLVQTGVIENSTTASFTITSADTTFANGLTVAINVVGDTDFSQAPANSTHTNSNAALAPPADGVRHLYKGGSTFSGSISIPGNSGWTFRNVQIGSYGGGGRATITGGIEVGSYSNSPPTAPLNGATVYGINMGTTQWGGGGGSCGNNTHVKNTLVWNCAFTSASWSWHNVAVSFCDNAVTGTGITTGDNNYNFYIGQGNGTTPDSDLIISGNVANVATYHTLRMFSVQTSVLSHNHFKGQCSSNPGGEIVKLHANQSSDPTKGTRYVVMRDNWVSDSTNTTMGLCTGAMPENNTYLEILQDVIIERQRCLTAIEDYEPGGARVTARGCTNAVRSVTSTVPGVHAYPYNSTMSGYNGPYPQV